MRIENYLYNNEVRRFFDSLRSLRMMPLGKNGHCAKQTKSPEIQRPQGRISIRGTTLLIPLTGNHSRTSNKVPACNGATGFHYWPMRSRNRLRNQIVPPIRTGSHQPPALCSLTRGTSFPSKSFGICAIHYNSKFRSCQWWICTIILPNLFRVLERKTFDFSSWTLYNSADM